MARGLPTSLDLDLIRFLLFSETGAIIWFMPLSVVFALNEQFWFTWLPKVRTLVIIGLIYVSVVMLLSITTHNILKDQMYNSTDFLFLSAFLIIFSRYRPHDGNLFLGYMGMAVLVSWMFLVNERFAIAYEGLTYCLYLLTIFLGKFRLDLKINTVAVMSFVGIFSLVIIMQVPIFHSYVNRYIFQGEILEDTRGGHSLSEAVTKDMTSSQKTFGKGILGTYTWGYRDWPPRPYIRSGVEIGYSELILRGGYLMVACFYILSLYAVFLGFFRSNNRLTRYLSLMIVARLIIMSTAMIPRAGFEYFLYWLIVGGCLSINLRALTDDQITNNCNITELSIKW